jgi:hypothetical protein
VSNPTPEVFAATLAAITDTYFRSCYAMPPESFRKAMTQSVLDALEPHVQEAVASAKREKDAGTKDCKTLVTDRPWSPAFRGGAASRLAAGIGFTSTGTTYTQADEDAIAAEVGGTR